MHSSKNLLIDLNTEGFSVLKVLNKDALILILSIMLY